MFTLENFMIVVITIGVLFLILGLLLLSNTLKLLSNQRKDFELIIDFVEEQFKQQGQNLTYLFNSYKPENIREVHDSIRSIEQQLRLGDLSATKIAINEILTQIKLGDLDQTKTTMYTILENIEKLKGGVEIGRPGDIKEAIVTLLNEHQHQLLNSKASITISANKGAEASTQQITNNLKLTEENINAIVNQLQPLVSNNSGKVETSSILLSTIAVTEVVLQELHDVESIYDEKGAVLEKISDDYTRTYDVVFKTLSEQLL